MVAVRTSSFLGGVVFLSTEGVVASSNGGVLDCFNLPGSDSAA